MASGSNYGELRQLRTRGEWRYCALCIFAIPALSLQADRHFLPVQWSFETARLVVTVPAIPDFEELK